MQRHASGQAFKPLTPTSACSPKALAHIARIHRQKHPHTARKTQHRTAPVKSLAANAHNNSAAIAACAPSPISIRAPPGKSTHNTTDPPRQRPVSTAASTHSKAFGAPLPHNPPTAAPRSLRRFCTHEANVGYYTRM